MKRFLPVLLVLFIYVCGKAQRPFITIWNTGNSGISNSNQIFLNATGSNFNVSWVNTTNAADTNHATINGSDAITFATQGIYKVYITPGNGNFSAIKLFDPNVDLGTGGDSKKLLSIEQWGDIQWSTFDSAFMSCYSMVLNATDVPNLSHVANMSSAFTYCLSLTNNAAMANWNVSNVTDMSYLFEYDGSFNQPIGKWNVSKVTNMNNMFGSATVFNQPLGNWNTGNVNDMTRMFYAVNYFNQPLNNWNVSKDTSMKEMFYADTVFNQPLNNWNVGSVTDMQAMFNGSAHFNQPIGNWNVSKVTNMSFMFKNDTSFNQPLNNWNVSSVTDMQSMFTIAYHFNQPLDSWNVGNVTNMNTMFAETRVFNQPLDSWNVSNVKNMNDMFGFTKAFNQSIGNWNVGKVTDMSSMFEHAEVFNQPLNNWNVSNVQNMNGTFFNAFSFNQPIGNWNVGNVVDMRVMLGAPVFNQPINNWNVSNVKNMGSMFVGAKAFNQSIGNWNVSHVINMEGMFNQASAFNQPIGNWDVSSVGTMLSMFNEATSFNQLIGNWNVSKVGIMYFMFYNASAFDQNIGSWHLANANNLMNMFDSSGMSCNNYGFTLQGWASSASTPNGLSLGAANLIYNVAAKPAHDSLTTLKGWTITGDKLGNCSILPITFLSFTAALQNSRGLLNWSVGEEINVKEYDVEKSSNGYNFSSIGFVKADVLQKSNYSFIDNNLANGANYYRIKELDNDGKFMLSSINKIEYAKFTWKVNGNPINNSSVSLMLDKSANISIQVISSNGKIVKIINKGILITGSYIIPLNINNFSDGIYMIRLIVDDKNYVSTVVKG